MGDNERGTRRRDTHRGGRFARVSGGATTMWFLALGLALVIALAWGLGQRAANAGQAVALRMERQRSFEQLVARTQAIENLLAKSLVTSAGGAGSLVFTDLWYQGLSAEDDLTRLPLGHQSVANTSRFMTQVADYSRMLVRKSVQDEPLTDDDYNVLLGMHQTAGELSMQLNELSRLMATGGFRWEALQGNMGARLEDATRPVRDGFGGIAEELQDLPTLIYDGPYSDHIQTMVPRGLPAGDVTLDQAMEVARRFAPTLAGSADYQAVHAGDVAGRMPAYSLILYPGGAGQPVPGQEQVPQPPSPDPAQQQAPQQGAWQGPLLTSPDGEPGEVPPGLLAVPRGALPGPAGQSPVERGPGGGGTTEADPRALVQSPDPATQPPGGTPPGGAVQPGAPNQTPGAGGQPDGRAAGPEIRVDVTKQGGQVVYLLVQGIEGVDTGEPVGASATPAAWWIPRISISLPALGRGLAPVEPAQVPAPVPWPTPEQQVPPTDFPRQPGQEQDPGLPQEPIPAPGRPGVAELTLTQAAERARQFLVERGFSRITPTYASMEEGVATCQFAALQDQVVLYPDQVKVKLRMSDGQVLGYEGMGYLMSHTQRQLPAIQVSESQARAKLNPRVEVIGARTVLIPTPSRGEALCHEFHVRLRDATFLVYINAVTGNEESIFRLIDQGGNGQLVM